MRRNGANLLVLAGAQSAREHNETVPLASLINAAASEVEEYQRVEVGAVPDCSIVGSAATDAVHLLAELIDNALRYSPPAEPVQVRAVYTTSGGVLVEVDDSGLGMTDSDLRIANMRLTAGGEVSPDSARHMGLFVAGRLARQHDMTVRLLGSANGVGHHRRSCTCRRNSWTPLPAGRTPKRHRQFQRPLRQSSGPSAVGGTSRRRAGHSRGGRIRHCGGRFRRCLGDLAAAAQSRLQRHHRGVAGERLRRARGAGRRRTVVVAGRTRTATSRTGLPADTSGFFSSRGDCVTRTPDRNRRRRCRRRLRSRWTPAW